MVDYDIISITNGKVYDVIKCENYSGCYKHLKQAKETLNKFSLENRPVSVVIPKHHLSKEEKEEYRKFFCNKAQKDSMNYIYFEDTVTVVEVNPLKGTMFEDF